MPLWIEPLLKMSSFLHYLRKQAALPIDLQKQVFKQTKLGEANLDNVILLMGLPANDPVYTKKWIHTRIFELLKKHKARVLEPVFDVSFVACQDDPAKFNAVIVLDGFSHMRLLDDGASEDSEEMKRKHKIDLLYADSEEEDAGKDEEEAKKEAERAKRAEEEKPKDWQCGVCTFINDLKGKQCMMCGSDAPSYEEIVAEHIAKLNVERKQKGEVVEVHETEPLHIKRLKMLQSDLRHMISHDQRLKLLAAIEEKKKKEKLEAALKAEEEAKNAKEQDKPEDSKDNDAKKEQIAKEQKNPEPSISASPMEAN